MNARTFDLTPFHRGTIGFENLINVLTHHHATSSNTGYPPYNIISVDENKYQIELAVAGFSMMELSITQDRDNLIIEGIPNEHEDDIPLFLHKGIANRNFIRTFQIAEHVEVKDASLELGILRITLERNVPEELQPKKIAITYKA
jgi:molecular chaperone IbpA